MALGFDEMVDAKGGVREHYRGYDRWLKEQPPHVMRSRRDEAEVIFRRVGITFAVYGAKDDDTSGQNGGTERLIPFDLIPRVIPADEWREMERGLRQRVTALNRFVHDVYHGQEILKAGIVPAGQVLGNAQYRKEMQGVDPARRAPGNNTFPRGERWRAGSPRDRAVPRWDTGARGHCRSSRSCGPDIRQRFVQRLRPMKTRFEPTTVVAPVRAACTSFATDRARGDVARNVVAGRPADARWATAWTPRTRRCNPTPRSTARGRRSTTTSMHGSRENRRCTSIACSSHHAPS